MRIELEVDSNTGHVEVVRKDVAPVTGPVTPTEVVFSAGGARALSDPSNAPEGYPTRSHGGYPLIYAIGGDGKPVGDPRLLYDAQTFANEDEIAGYKVAVAARDEALAQAPADDASKYIGHINPDDMGLYDWAFYQKRGLHFAPGDYAIFTKHPIIRDPAGGRVLQNPEGELAAVDISAYGGPLAQFV